MDADITDLHPQAPVYFMCTSSAYFDQHHEIILRLTKLHLELASHRS